MDHDRSKLCRPFWWLAAALLVVVTSVAALLAQSERTFSITGRKYTYVVSDASSPEIRVRQDDLVIITFSADDIAHSLTIRDDHYRIDRRAEPGKPVTFRFRADKAGSFDIQCTLSIDARCQKEMRGRLIVEPK